jgi:hypothetical protein
MYTTIRLYNDPVKSGVSKLDGYAALRSRPTQVVIFEPRHDGDRTG